MTKVINKTEDPKKEAGSKKLGFQHVPISNFLSGAVGMLPGVPKYGAKNWVSAKEHLMSIYLDGIQRHYLLLVSGEDYVRDTDGLIHHLDAIISGASVLKDSILMGKCKDDRVKYPKEAIDRVAEILCGKEYANLPMKNVEEK